MMKKPIIITPGEPAGIGPDLVIQIAQKPWPIKLVICADPNLLIQRAKKIGLPIKLKKYIYNDKNNSPAKPGELFVLQKKLNAPVVPGKLDIKNNNYTIQTLILAIQKCLNKEFSALVTGPINKAILNKQGISFPGHTEFLAKYSKTKNVVMMLKNKKMKIALTTRHLPISAVSKAITKQSLCDTIHTLIKGLKKYFNILNPKIYVCGLNPHAGECGYLGQEEINVIQPALSFLKNTMNYNLIGPLPSDTLFQPKYLNHADAILAMYHDQGLPVLKYSDFGHSVNITFGLPFIRTSVDHGTALDLSGTKLTSSSSMSMAIKTAIKMIKRQKYNYD